MVLLLSGIIPHLLVSMKTDQLHGSFTSMSDAPAASVATLDTATGTWNTPGGMRWRNGPARVTAAAITSTGNAHVISAGA
jgi:hypothetical protein